MKPALRRTYATSMRKVSVTSAALLVMGFIALRWSWPEAVALVQGAGMQAPGLVVAFAAGLLMAGMGPVLFACAFTNRPSLTIEESGIRTVSLLGRTRKVRWASLGSFSMTGIGLSAVAYVTGKGADPETLRSGRFVLSFEFLEGTRSAILADIERRRPANAGISEARAALSAERSVARSGPAWLLGAAMVLGSEIALAVLGSSLYAMASAFRGSGSLTFAALCFLVPGLAFGAFAGRVKALSAWTALATGTTAFLAVFAVSTLPGLVAAYSSPDVWTEAVIRILAVAAMPFSFVIAARASASTGDIGSSARSVR